MSCVMKVTNSSYISGKNIKIFNFDETGNVKIENKDSIEFIHPEIETFVDNKPLQSIIPTYSLRGVISQQKIRKLIVQAFKILSNNYKFSALDDYFNEKFS